MRLVRYESLLLRRADNQEHLHITQETKLHRLLDEPLLSLTKSSVPRLLPFNPVVRSNFTFAHFVIIIINIPE